MYVTNEIKRHTIRLIIVINQVIQDAKTRVINFIEKQLRKSSQLHLKYTITALNGPYDLNMSLITLALCPSEGLPPQVQYMSSPLEAHTPTRGTHTH